MINNEQEFTSTLERAGTVLYFFTFSSFIFSGGFHFLQARSRIAVQFT
jgi:hypothetical protein